MGSLESASPFGHRILFLSESISTEVANRPIAGLLLLDADDHKAPIDLYINCPGGSVIDAIQCIRAPVHTICVGRAASMAACLLASGSPGHRYASPNTEVMLHQVAASFAGQETLTWGEYLSSKFDDFVFDPKLRRLFGQKRSTIDLQQTMDSEKILLVNLAKGELSESNARFLGMVLMAKIMAAAMQRRALPLAERRPAGR